jgi:hypothetical protein
MADKERRYARRSKMSAIDIARFRAAGQTVVTDKYGFLMSPEDFSRNPAKAPKRKIK